MSQIPSFEGVSKVCPMDHLWLCDGFCLASDRNSRDRFFFLYFCFISHVYTLILKMY